LEFLNRYLLKYVFCGDVNITFQMRAPFLTVNNLVDNSSGFEKQKFISLRGGGGHSFSSS